MTRLSLLNPNVFGTPKRCAVAGAVQGLGGWGPNRVGVTMRGMKAGLSPIRTRCDVVSLFRHSFLQYTPQYFKAALS